MWMNVLYLWYQRQLLTRFMSITWWRHQIETFSALLAICAGIHRSPVNSPHKGQWHGALIFFFDLSPNKRLSKQSWGWWFETPSRPLWRHRYALMETNVSYLWLLKAAATTVYVYQNEYLNLQQRIVCTAVNPRIQINTHVSTSKRNKCRVGIATRRPRFSTVSYNTILHAAWQ